MSADTSEAVELCRELIITVLAALIVGILPQILLIVSAVIAILGWTIFVSDLV